VAAYHCSPSYFPHSITSAVSISRGNSLIEFSADHSIFWRRRQPLGGHAPFRCSARLPPGALERGAAGRPFRAVAEEGIPFREIAAVIGRRLNVPVTSKSKDEAAAHFGWFATFAGMELAASSARTRALLGWEPKQPGLLADIDHPSYFRA
jgi:hypothetical protein